jgi:succinate dehydrogenase/fumarate reductase flavoprotein subunit
MIEQTCSTEVLIVGGGAAGCFAAIRAREMGAQVVLLNKGIFGQDGASTWMAGPALQAAMYPPDSPEIHAADVVKVGRFIGDQSIIFDYTRRLPAIIDRLYEWGLRYVKDDRGRYVLTRYPGQTHPRVIQIAREGGYSGPQYRRILPRKVEELGAKSFDDMFVTDLLTDGNRVTGAVAIDLREGKQVAFQAKTVILATGGFMGLYPRTASPAATGDGVALAWRAGAELADMEFTDFYAYIVVRPATCHGDDWPALIMYHLNATLYNRFGEDFMKRYTGAKRVPPRASALELRAGRGSPHGGVYLSVRHLPGNLVEDYLREIGSQRWLDDLKDVNFDLRQDAVEIAPAGITSFGGCRINERCETSLENLYAAGETASGHQGAYVLVGNMVGTACALGSVAGEQAAARALKMRLPELDHMQAEEKMRKAAMPLERQGGPLPVEVRSRVADVLGKYAYIVGRNDTGMRQGLQELEAVKRDLLPNITAPSLSRRMNRAWWQAVESENAVELAKLVLASALERTESRGSHYRDDYPEEHPEWVKRIVVKQKDGARISSIEPVNLSHIKPTLKAAPV